MNIISIGSECSTATALKGLNLRKYALPFDWTNTTKSQLLDCLKDDFARFHHDVKLMGHKKRVIDGYGIEYPHDYPTELIQEESQENYSEYKIIDNWKEYTKNILSKYQRRIERFRDVMRDHTPIIVLFRSNIRYAKQIRDFLCIKYKRDNIVFLVATKESHSLYHNIIVCDPEKKGDWNNLSIWEEGIERAKNYQTTNKIHPLKCSIFAPFRNNP